MKSKKVNATMITNHKNKLNAISLKLDREGVTKCYWK